MKISTQKLTFISMLCAISVVLVSLIHFPIFPAAPFLEYDPGDIPIIIGAFLFGPYAGLLITVAVSFIQGFTVSAQSGIIGIVMHIFATGALVLVAGAIYKKMNSTTGAILAMQAGVLAMTATMVLWNIIITPIYLGAPREAVIGMLIPIIIPFNLFKAGLNSVISFGIYKAASPVIRRILNENAV